MGSMKMGCKGLCGAEGGDAEDGMVSCSFLLVTGVGALMTLIPKALVRVSANDFDCLLWVLWSDRMNLSSALLAGLGSATIVIVDCRGDESSKIHFVARFLSLCAGREQSR
jgi:hypothetical protein